MPVLLVYMAGIFAFAGGEVNAEALVSRRLFVIGVSVGWLALMGPAGIPDGIVRKVAADMKTVLATPEVIERFHVLGTYPIYMGPEQLFEFMRAEERLWWPIVREVNREQGTTPR